MADSYLGGGKALAYFFRVKRNDDSYDLVKIDGISSASAIADASLKLTLMKSTKPEPQDDGTLQITWDNYQCGPDITDFLNAVAMKSASQSQMPEWTKEDGVKMGGASNDNLVLAMIIGTYDPVNEKYLCHYALGIIKSTSGGMTQQADDWAKPTLVFAGKFAEFDLEIPIACQDETILEPSVETIAANYCFVRKWIPEKIA